MSRELVFILIVSIMSCSYCKIASSLKIIHSVLENNKSNEKTSKELTYFYVANANNGMLTAGCG
jgi:hypothetical protein